MGHGLYLIFALTWKSAETSQKIWEELFFWRTPDLRGKSTSTCGKNCFFRRSPDKIFRGPFFSFLRTMRLVSLFFGLEHSFPWPWKGLSLALASDLLCVLGLEACAFDSTCVSYICFPIGLVFYQHLISHIAYPDFTHSLSWQKITLIWVNWEEGTMASAEIALVCGLKYKLWMNSHADETRIAKIAFNLSGTT